MLSEGWISLCRKAAPDEQALEGEISTQRVGEGRRGEQKGSRREKQCAKVRGRPGLAHGGT